MIFTVVGFIIVSVVSVWGGSAALREVRRWIRARRDTRKIIAIISSLTPEEVEQWLR